MDTSVQERIGIVWPLTKEIASLSPGMMWNEDYKDILQSLANEGADFILVGAHTPATHGYPHATMDIDIRVRPQ